MKPLALPSILLLSVAAVASAHDGHDAKPAPATAAAKASPAAAAAPAASAATPVPAAAKGAPAAGAYDKFKALAGDWIDVDGTFGQKGKVAVSYRLTGGGSTLVETLFAGQPEEMMTMYSRDGADLVLTHYCAGGNQPRMRATTVDGNIVRFRFDGGTNFDAAKDSHMHSAWFEFLSADEIRGGWEAWNEGKPSDHSITFHLKRKAA